MPGSHAALQDASAFTSFYDRTHLIVYRYIYGLHGGPEAEVEDLTAEVYARAWQARSRFSGDQFAALGWLLKIARNLVIDAHRRRSARRSEFSLPVEALAEQATSHEAGPEEQTLQREKFRTLWRLLQALPDELREMIVLRYLLDWPVKDIARQLNLPENTVSVYLRRGLERIRLAWPVADKAEKGA
jgi:RNA polymerase sigma-70 factor (ECF subfamily)